MENLTKSGHFRTFGTRPHSKGSIFGQFSDDTSITAVEGVKMHDGLNSGIVYFAGIVLGRAVSKIIQFADGLYEVEYMF